MIIIRKLNLNIKLRKKLNIKMLKYVHETNKQSNKAFLIIFKNRTKIIRYSLLNYTFSNSGIYF